MSLNNQRIIQHRPEREEKQKNKLLAETKRENHLLKRKLAREHKRREQLESILDSIGVEYSIEEEKSPETPEETPNPEPQPEKLNDGCPECGGEVRVVTLAGKNFAICECCLWRRPIHAIAVA